MAVRVDAAADFLSRTSDFPQTNGFALSFWFYMNSDRNAAGTLASMINNTGAVYQGVYFRSTGTTLALDISGSITDGSELAAGNWYHLFWQRIGTAHSLYLNGVLDISVTQAISLTPAFFLLGSNTLNYVDGRYAHLKVWSGLSSGFSTAEIQSEMQAIRPVRFANIHSWTPLFYGTSERTRDYSGNGRGWAENGTLTDEANPPVSWGAGSLLLPYAVAGGITYFQSVSGTITPTGILTRQTNKTLAGGVTPTGAISKRTSKSFAGSITPTGALTAIKIALISLAGSITPIGALTRQTNKALTGSVTPSGTITKRISKILAGGITPSGALTTVKVALLSLVGSITPSGTLTRRTDKGLSGGVQPIGTLIKSTAKAFAGSITPTGAISRLVGKALTGTVTPAATLIRRTTKALTGAVTPAAQLIKSISKSFTGGITPTSTFSAIANAVTQLPVVAGVIFDAAYYGSVIYHVAYWTSVISDQPYWRSQASDRPYWNASIDDKPYWDSD